MIKYNIGFFTSETIVFWYVKGANIKTVLIAMQAQLVWAL